MLNVGRTLTCETIPTGGRAKGDRTLLQLDLLLLIGGMVTNILLCAIPNRAVDGFACTVKQQGCSSAHVVVDKRKFGLAGHVVTTITYHHGHAPEAMIRVVKDRRGRKTHSEPVL